MRTVGLLALASLLLVEAAPGWGLEVEIKETTPDAGVAVDAEAKEAEAIDEGNRSFLGVKFNPSFGVVTIKGRVDEVQVVGTGADARVVVTKAPEAHPVALLEFHRLLDLKNVFGARKKDAVVRGLKVAGEEVRAALGPFVTIQSSQSSVIDSFGVGLMLGLRSGESSAFNLGLGTMLDPNAKVLAEGVVNGAPPPQGRTDFLTTTRSKWGWVLLASFSF